MINTYKGDWETEQDFYSWTDAVTGYNCRIVRINGTGHLCGYVELHLEYPYTSEQLDQLGLLDDIDVHGGVTFKGGLDNEEDDWIGFDALHTGDACPSGLMKGIYRNANYMKTQCELLAFQLLEIEKDAKKTTND